MTPTDNFYRSTGLVIRKWAEVEYHLALWLTDLLSIDEFRARLLWDSYGDLRSKLNLLKMLTRNFAEERLWREAKAIVARVETIAQNRYILPHAFGDVDAAERGLTFISEKIDSDYLIDFVGERTVDIETLKGWIGDMDQSLEAIAGFKAKLAGNVHHASLMHRRVPAS